ncbi:type II methionyl aminopeptidase [Candidatus Woesearchaeota archaeon CG10_big_fil_rev_8_21_14_0_10_34_12]|nr:MAG: type II methionyl aminopeptidase [Candidatus Woesearchaeota archaeon CG10_big_fil_rev_8_21_14_0_10_34_12]
MVNEKALEKANKICRETISYAKSIIKPGMLLLDIAEKIENKIIELGGKPGFPTNLCINEIAAHDTPSSNDERIAEGLLKVDIGVSVDGWVADYAFSLDLEDNEENKQLIEASDKALAAALRMVKKGVKLGEIGKAIEEEIEKKGFTSIKNLSGHEIGHYELHAGLTIPNYSNKSDVELDGGIYAIEPFATSGQGLIYDGKESGIFRIENSGNVRDATARKILKFVEEEYKTLPFCERWIKKKFPNSRFAISLLKKSGILHEYSTLVEKSHKPVSQSEATVII